MKKRALALLLTLVMVFGMLPVSGLAAGPTEISTQEQLAKVKSGSYKLTADIALTSDWTPITPDIGAVFQFDGNGHTITLNGKPLFKDIEVGCTVSNLVLDGTVTSNETIGALSPSNRGTVRNTACYAKVTYTGDGGGWNPHYAAGLIGAANDNASLVINCLYAGTLEKGSAGYYGAIANEKGKMEHCVGVGSDRIGSKQTVDENLDFVPAPIDIGNNKLITSPETFRPEDYVSHFNANLQPGDLPWEVVDGKLRPKPQEVAPEANATPEEITALTDAIAAAEIDKTVIYTAATWAEFRAALSEANNVAASNQPKQSVVTKATQRLTEAQTNLQKRVVEAKAQPTDVVAVNQSNFKEHMQNPVAGKFYKLTEDIVLDQMWSGGIVTMNSVLDGDGHTITLGGAPIWNEIGPEGVIQNLGLKGLAQNGSSDTGALAKDCHGLIINCWSHTEVVSEGMNGNRKNAGGLTANLHSGGAIVNSYVAGSVNAKGSGGNGAVGALAGTTAENTLLQTSYWLSGASGTAAAGSIQGLDHANASKERVDFYSQELIDLLNANKGTYGKFWTVSNEGWPHLGEAGNYVPPPGHKSGIQEFEGPKQRCFLYE